MATTAPPTGVSNAELIRWAFDVINTRDITPLRSMWTDATVERFPQGTCYGSDAIARYFEDLFGAVPDVHIRIVAIAEQGDDVFVQWHLTGTHTGTRFEGIEATGRAVAIDGINHFVVRDAVVVSNFVVSDLMQFARQVGLLPPDRSLADRALKGAFNAKTRLLRRRHNG